MVIALSIRKADGPNNVSSAVLRRIVALLRAGAKSIVPPGQISAIAWRNDPEPESSAFVTVMSTGQATVTVKEHSELVLPAASDVVHEAVVSPSENCDPDGGVQLV